jgi:BASS family bile acid:Na+ symporter
MSVEDGLLHESKVQLMGKLLQFMRVALTKFLALWLICSSLVAYHYPDHFNMIRNGTSFALAFILFNMGLALPISSLKAILLQPKNAFIGVAGKWTITIGISLLLAFLFFPGQPALIAGIILAGAVPSGTSANLYTLMAGGTLALSILMSAIDTLIGPFFTPTIMKYTVGSVVPVPFFSLFIKMVYVVLLPILLGLFIQWKWGNKLGKLREIIPLFSSAALIFINLAVVSSAQHILHLNINLLPVLLLCVFLQITVPMVLGYFCGAAFRMPEADRRSIVYEFGICNTALASILAIEYISPIAAVPAVINMITNTSIGALIAVSWDPIAAKWAVHKKRADERGNI